MIKIQKSLNKGFTILELMISMTLFAMILTSVIVAVGNLSITRIKTLNRVALLEELYFFSEQLFSVIKDGGTLDYEEYWNRQAVSMVTNTGGHYDSPTGIGNYGGSGLLLTTNYGSGIYLCRSNGAIPGMGSGGCLSNHNNGADGNHSGSVVNFSGTYQRYGEYLAQFTDYNGNADADLGDEDEGSDASGSIIGDDDDDAIGDVPAISSGAMIELYLINKNTKKRTYFRWNIEKDPNTTIPFCTIDTTTIPGRIITGSGCIGNVQVLRTSGFDVGLSHSGSVSDKTAYDGIIDTWVCDEDRGCIGPSHFGKHIATGNDAEWVNLFPGTINVKNFSLQIYPVKDPWLSWATSDCSTASCISPFIHPYVRMNLEMGFAWGKRRAIRNDDPTISISTSLSLSDFE